MSQRTIDIACSAEQFPKRSKSSFLQMHFRPLQLFRFCALLLCLCGTTGQAAQLNRAVQYHGIAHGNYLIGDYQGALRALEVCLKNQPDYLPALRLKVRVLLDQDDVDQARKVLSKALEDHPEDPGLQALQVKAERPQSDTTAAPNPPGEAIGPKSNSGENPDTLIRQRIDHAKQLAKAGKIEAATRRLEQLRGERPENLEVNLTLASLYANSGQWAQVDGLVPQIRQDPRLQDVALYLEGRVAFSLDRIGTARARFEEAIGELPPEGGRLGPSLHFYHGLCLERLGRKEAAEKALNRAIDSGFQAETIAEAEALGHRLLRKGQAHAAISQLERVLLSRGDAPAALWSQLGRAHEMADQVSLAISAFNQALQLDPEQAEVLALRGSLLRRIGDLTGARRDYQKAVILKPENAALHYALGLTQLQLGALTEAEQAIGQSAGMAGDTPGQQLLHALTAHAIGAVETAREALLRYLENHPDEPASSAVYLAHLLELPSASPLDDPVLRYFRDAASRKEVLDWAGYAETPADARRRICAAAYWLAQKMRLNGESAAARELLEIAVRQGSPDHPEYQFATWQLKHLPSEKSQTTNSTLPE